MWLRKHGNALQVSEMGPTVQPPAFRVCFPQSLILTELNSAFPVLTFLQSLKQQPELPSRREPGLPGTERDVRGVLPGWTGMESGGRKGGPAARPSGGNESAWEVWGAFSNTALDNEGAPVKIANT